MQSQFYAAFKHKIPVAYVLLFSVVPDAEISS